MRGRERQPLGFARSDYSTPCPECRDQIRKGQQVTRVDLATGSGWWHLACRNAALARLRAERDEPASRARGE